ncbi:MAG: ABC transporter substrate-binding protein [Planctomycetota bacterium]
MERLLALVLLLLLCVACAPLGTSGSPRPLVCASDLDHPPFASVDDSGAPVGFEVDLMHDLAAELGRPLVWRRLPFVELLPAVEAGAVDLACATLGATPERAERMLLSRPYFRTRIALLALAGPEGERSGAPAALDGRPVGFAAGTTAEDAVRSGLPAAQAVPLGKGESPVEALESGRAVAVAVDGPDADLWAERPGLTVLPFALGAEDYVLAVAPGRVDLVRALDRVLARWDASGRLDELWRRCLDESGNPFSAP